MTRLFAIAPLALIAACSDVEEHDHIDEQEVITTVNLTFTNLNDGSEALYTWADPENDGDPTIDDISLVEGEAYSLSVAFFNALEEPAEEITGEVFDEGYEHQLFFTGSAVVGPATGENADAIVEHSYADEDENGLPVGLENSITAIAFGAGELTVTLRHLPEESGAAVKVEGLADDVAEGGFGAIGGENDVQVSFYIEVE